MKILDATIEWHHGYSNSPELTVTVESVPDFDPAKPIWNMADNGVVWAEEGPLIKYQYMGNGMVDEGRAMRGFGGQLFEFTLKDGTVIRSNDSWSSRAARLPFEATEVRVREHKTGYVYSGYAMRMEQFRKIIAQLGFNIVPNWEGRMVEISSHPEKAEKPPQQQAS